MRWGHIPSSSDPSALLVWALTFAIEDPLRSMMENITDILVHGREIGGDPGWEIHRYLDNSGCEYFDVWVDSRVSGIEKSHAIYSADVVRTIARKVLNAYANANPERRSEVEQLLVDCKLTQ